MLCNTIQYISYSYVYSFLCNTMQSAKLWIRLFFLIVIFLHYLRNIYYDCLTIYPQNLERYLFQWNVKNKVSIIDNICLFYILNYFRLHQLNIKKFRDRQQELKKVVKNTLLKKNSETERSLIPRIVTEFVSFSLQPLPVKEKVSDRKVCRIKLMWNTI